MMMMMMKITTTTIIVYQQIHHVRFVVSQRFNGVKNVDAALLSQHLTHDTDTTEHTTATSSITEEQRRGGGEERGRMEGEKERREGSKEREEKSRMGGEEERKKGVRIIPVACCSCLSPLDGDKASVMKEGTAQCLNIGPAEL